MTAYSGKVLEMILIFVILYQNAEVVELGRHARLRGVWGNPCGFESRLRHHLFLFFIKLPGAAVARGLRSYGGHREPRG